MDVFTKEKRSEIMSAIRSKDSKFEQSFLKWFSETVRDPIRLHPKDVMGCPDVVLKNKKIIFFLDSCFWHGCKIHCRVPKSNQEYWSQKIKRNRSRDKLVNACLKKQGWKVIRIWEHSWKHTRTAKWWHTRVLNILNRDAMTE